MHTDTAEAEPTWVPGESETAQPVGSEPAEPPEPDHGDPQPQTSDSSRGAPSRGYVVLEEKPLGELVRKLADDMVLEPALKAILDRKTVYTIAAQPDARNTEHAYRQAAKEVQGDNGEALMIAISGRYWTPTPVRTRTDTVVTIGE